MSWLNFIETNFFYYITASSRSGVFMSGKIVFRENYNQLRASEARVMAFVSCNLGKCERGKSEA